MGRRTVVNCAMHSIRGEVIRRLAILIRVFLVHLVLSPVAGIVFLECLFTRPQGSHCVVDNSCGDILWIKNLKQFFSSGCHICAVAKSMGILICMAATFGEELLPFVLHHSSGFVGEVSGDILSDVDSIGANIGQSRQRDRPSHEDAQKKVTDIHCVVSCSYYFGEILLFDGVET